jgi:hypothetical protein
MWKLATGIATNGMVLDDFVASLNQKQVDSNSIN